MINKDLAQWAQDYALKQGADEVAIYVSKTRSVSISRREGIIENLKESTQNSLSLDLYLNHKYSSHSTNDLKKTSLEKFISEAIASTKYLTSDEFRYLPDPKFYPKTKKYDLQLLDKKYENVNPEDRKEKVAVLEEFTRDLHPALISVTAGYSDSLHQAYVLHSNGFEGESERTRFSLGVDVTLQEEHGGKPEDGYWASTNIQRDLPDFQEIGKNAVHRAVRKLGQDKLASGTYDMIIENQTGGRLLWGLKNAMSGGTIFQKASFLEGMSGQKIGSEKLTLIDDPFIPRSSGSRHYDGEGLAAKRRVMIENGVLKNFFIDTYYGRKLGMKPTSGSTSNLIFEYGSRNSDAMIQDVDRGILVTGFIGGNSNSTTGDFSVGIVGQLIEKGKIVRPVNEMNLSENSLTFWQKLVETGNDPRPYSGWKTPSMRFDNIYFSGK